MPFFFVLSDFWCIRGQLYQKQQFPQQTANLQQIEKTQCNILRLTL